MILQYKPMAEGLAVKVWKTAPYVLDMEELKAIALLGLVQVADRWPKYCEENGFDAKDEQYFKTVAMRRVKGAIFDALRKDDWLSRADRAVLKKLREVGLDDNVDIESMSEESGVSKKHINHTLTKAGSKPVHLEDSAPGSDVTHADTLVAPDDVESSSQSDNILKLASDTVRAMEPQAQVILALHYFEGKELQEVAKLMGLTESRASHIHTEAVLKLREVLMEELDDGTNRRFPSSNTG